jgi:hypothetical protein
MIKTMGEMNKLLKELVKGWGGLLSTDKSVTLLPGANGQTHGPPRNKSFNPPTEQGKMTLLVT